MEIVSLNRDSFPQYISAFANLYLQCFHVSMSEDEIYWRYLNNPNREILSCIALDNGEMVANYSVSPIKLIKNGLITKCALSMNIMTHPSYIKQGLLVELENRVCERLKASGYNLMMVFPNNISHRTLVAGLGWHTVCTIPFIELDLTATKEKPVNQVYRIIEDHAYRLDYSKCIQHKDKCCVYKDSAYLQWRYAAHPVTDYRCYAITDEAGRFASSRVILKEYRNRINLVDTYFANEAEAKVLINHCIAYGKSLGKDLLTCWLPLNSSEHIWLERYGITLNAPVTYFCIKYLDTRFESNQNEADWYLSMSDDNVY